MSLSAKNTEPSENMMYIWVQTGIDGSIAYIHTHTPRLAQFDQVRCYE